MILDEIATGMFLGIIYGGMSSLVVMLISIAYRYFTEERFSSIMGIIIGLGVVGISGGLLAILEQPTVGGGVQILVASFIIAIGVTYGDKMAVQIKKYNISITKMLVRGRKSSNVIVKMPSEKLIRNIPGKPRVMDSLKKELSGKELIFPSDLPVEELAKRVRRQLITDWGLGDVEVELNEEGEVTYLAVGYRVQSISETIGVGYVALPLEYNVAPSGLAPRDIVRVHLEDGTYINRSEVKGIDRESRTITIMVDESLLEKFEGKKAKQIIALPTSRPVLLVKDIMTATVKTTSPDADVQSAVQLMKKFKIGSVVVVEEEKPIGIITDRDILERVLEPGLNAKTTKIEEIMSSPPISIGQSETLDKAVELMKSNKIKKLLVMDNEEMVGIVTARDFMRTGRIVQ